MSGVKMKGIQLDLTGCKGYYELQERIRQAFDFPNFYGHNWSAFWELLWSECDADRVEMTGEGTLPGYFKKDLAKLHEILERNAEFCEQNNFAPFLYRVIS